MKKLSKLKKNYYTYGVANLREDKWRDSLTGEVMSFDNMLCRHNSKMGLHSNKINLKSIQRINPLIKISRR